MSNRVYKLLRIYKSGKQRSTYYGRADMCDMREFARTSSQETNIKIAKVILNGVVIYSVDATGNIFDKQ